jgi:hypothetical protein
LGKCFLHLVDFNRKRKKHEWTPFYDRLFGADWFRQLVLIKVKRNKIYGRTFWWLETC